VVVGDAGNFFSSALSIGSVLIFDGSMDWITCFDGEHVSCENNQTQFIQNTECEATLTGDNLRPMLYSLLRKAGDSSHHPDIQKLRELELAALELHKCPSWGEVQPDAPHRSS
jgi:hypothetical protein